MRGYDDIRWCRVTGECLRIRGNVWELGRSSDEVFSWCQMRKSRIPDDNPEDISRWYLDDKILSWNPVLNPVNLAQNPAILSPLLNLFRPQILRSCLLFWPLQNLFRPHLTKSLDMYFFFDYSQRDI